MHRLGTTWQCNGLTFTIWQRVSWQIQQDSWLIGSTRFTSLLAFTRERPSGKFESTSELASGSFASKLESGQAWWSVKSRWLPQWVRQGVIRLRWLPQWSDKASFILTVILIIHRHCTDAWESTTIRSGASIDGAETLVRLIQHDNDSLTIDRLFFMALDGFVVVRWWAAKHRLGWSCSRLLVFYLWGVFVSGYLSMVLLLKEWVKNQGDESSIMTCDWS